MKITIEVSDETVAALKRLAGVPDGPQPASIRERWRRADMITAEASALLSVAVQEKMETELAK